MSEIETTGSAISRGESKARQGEHLLLPPTLRGDVVKLPFLLVSAFRTASPALPTSTDDSYHLTALSKLGLKKVEGVTRVVIRRAKNVRSPSLRCLSRVLLPRKLTL